jgi:sugar/nucleoside kinase (ribokinase family)
VGDVYVDLLCRVTDLPVWGEDRAASTTLLSAGGSTANTARFLGAVGGVAVRLFSAIGDDAFGAFFRAEDPKTRGRPAKTPAMDPRHLFARWFASHC